MEAMTQAFVEGCRNIGISDQAIFAELQAVHDEREQQKVLALASQKRVAEATAKIEHAGVDGLGEKVMQVDADAYHYWGGRLGYDCWQDKQFRREFARDNEAVRVRNVARKPVVNGAKLIVAGKYSRVR